MANDIAHDNFRRGFLYRVANSRERGTWHAVDGEPVLHLVVSLDSVNALPTVAAVNGVPRRTRMGADLGPLSVPSFVCGVKSPTREAGATLDAEYDCWQILRILKNQPAKTPGLRIGRNVKHVEAMIRSCLSANLTGPVVRHLASAPTPEYHVTAPRGSVVEYSDKQGIGRLLLVLSNDKLQNYRKLVTGVLVRQRHRDDADVLPGMTVVANGVELFVQPWTVRTLDLFRKCNERTRFGRVQLTGAETDEVVNLVLRHLGIQGQQP